MTKYICRGCEKERDSDETTEVWFGFDPGVRQLSMFDYEETYGYVCSECAKNALKSLNGKE